MADTKELDSLVGIFGSLGLILNQLRDLSDSLEELHQSVEQLRADVRALIAAQQKKDD